MAADPQPKKIPLVFFRTLSGSEPVREWLKELPEEERQAIGKDLLRAQWRWPVGMPLCRAMGSASRKAAQRRMRIWRWRGSARRSWSNEQETHGFEH
jgi:hypothetical protein